MREKYNDGVLDEKFTNIHEKMDEQFEASMKVLADIKEQTTKTNGRVTALEKGREWLLGFIYAFGLFMTVIVIPLLGLSLYEIFVVIPDREAQQPAATADALEGVLNSYGLRQLPN